MKRILCLVLALILLCTGSACGVSSPKEAEVAADKATLSVHFIDVGQGDSILLESDGEFILIDAGEFEYGEKVLSFINDRCADKIKYMIATHPHSDHIGGLRTVLDSIPTENFITVETDADTFGWTKTLKRVEDEGINYIDAVPGNQYTFGSSKFTILGPVDHNYEGYNNYSVVIKAECGDISFLLTGDAERKSEYEMLDAGEDLSADVLKCGHHGSSDATTTRLLKAVDPVFAVVSCAKNNDYGHPHKETLEKLDLLSTQVFRTDTQGSISFYTDGTSLTVSSNGERIASYTTGEKRTTPEKLNYIGNRSSLFFHDPTCEGGKTMKEKNKVTFSTREEAIKQGYSPCPHCNP